MRFGEQARVLRMIPGLENAEFLRFGQVHRNTYINSPTLLRETLQMEQHPNVLFAGQISGVEGYVESIATGLLAGNSKPAQWQSTPNRPLPRARHSVWRAGDYISNAEAKHFQPANITFDLLMPLDEATRRRVRDRSSATRWSASGRWRNCRDGWKGSPQRLGASIHLRLTNPPPPSYYFSYGPHVPTAPIPSAPWFSRDLIRDVFQTLWAHKLRTALTMSGIAWGVISIVLMVAAGEGLRVGQAKVSQEFGRDLMIIFAGRTSMQAGGTRAGRRIEFEESDVDTLTQDQSRLPMDPTGGRPERCPHPQQLQRSARELSLVPIRRSPRFAV